jgi:preprotein translocase subunit SecA
MLRPEIEALLLKLAHEKYVGARMSDELDQKFRAAFPAPSAKDKVAPAPDHSALADLADWANRNLGLDLNADRLAELGANEAEIILHDALDAKHRPEMREMEKVVLLQILDSGWMEHLRAMDHLRSSIGLQGYAQIDPKVEYKREGMRIFAEMWTALADRATDLIFRVEHFDPEFLSYLGSRWNLDRATTIHQQAESQLGSVPASGGLGTQREQATSANQQSTEKKREPLRHTGKKVGRNDPCPCGSGKKFKACCMRNQATADLF